MRRLLFAVSLSLSAAPAIAQDGIPAAPDIILAVADGLVELRGMIATCAPETVLPDDEASWAAMTEAVAAALWRGGKTPRWWPR